MCVCARAQWESLGAWGKESQLWGQLHREERTRGENRGMGEGRTRVKGSDVVSLVFEISAGRDSKEGGA